MKHSILKIALIFIISVSLSFWTQGVDLQESGKAKSTEEAKGKAPSMLKETTSVTKHSVTIQGTKIDYTATAGNMILREEDGKAKGSIFYIAYSRDGVKNPSQRPLMFCFNGGPGWPSGSGRSDNRLPA